MPVTAGRAGIGPFFVQQHLCADCWPDRHTPPVRSVVLRDLGNEPFIFMLMLALKNALDLWLLRAGLRKAAGKAAFPKRQGT